ncbi:hypothetical protein B5M44_14190 [Shinella sumterensis]|nr:hypothetical protein B5M44_14190 [Shinella sumterensis]
MARLLGLVIIELVDVLALPGSEASALSDMAERVDDLAEASVAPHLSDLLRMVSQILGGRPTVQEG